MRQRQATALKASGESRMLHSIGRSTADGDMRPFLVALGNDAAFHKRVVAGTCRDQCQVPRRATVLVSAVRRSYERASQYVASASPIPATVIRSGAAATTLVSNHDESGFVQYQVAVERPILVIQHRNRTARGRPSKPPWGIRSGNSA